MKVNSLKASLGAGALLAAALTLNAGPLQRADLPADPAWLVHADVDRLRPTTIGQYLQAEMDKPEAQAKLAVFQSVCSVDLRTQLHGLTLYGASLAPANGVLLIYADFDPDRLVTLAKASQDHQSTPYKDHTIHNWIDEKKKPHNGVKPRVYATIQGKRVIFGQAEAAVERALDVLDGTVPNLASGKAFADFGSASDASFIEAAARKMDVPSNDPNAAIFRLSKNARLQINEAGGQLKASLTLEAADEDTANHILSIGQGLIGLLKLQNDKPDAQKLADALMIKQNGSSVAATVGLPASDFVAMMKADAARKAAKKASKANEEGGGSGDSK